MKTTEVNKELIGKRCECIFTGLMVTGVIEDIQDDQHSTAVKVRFDHPHQWGDDLYNDVWAWGRKIDEFGTLHHLHLLEDKPDFQTRVRDNILKSKEQKNIQPTKGGHKMVTCQNYVSLFYRQITSCPSDGGIS